MDVLLMLLCVSSLSYPGAVSAITSTCNTHQVTAGETATVTCHLGEDVKSQGHDVIVQRYVKNVSYPEVVMHCYWPDDREQEYKCAMYRNCNRTTDVTETVTVALPNAQVNAEGLYYCEVVADDYRYKTCNLSISTDEPRVPPTPVPADGPERRDAGDSTAEREIPEPAEGGSIPLWMAISLMVVGVIVGIGGVAAGCVLKKREKKRSKGSKGVMLAMAGQEQQSLNKGFQSV